MAFMLIATAMVILMPPGLASVLRWPGAREKTCRYHHAEPDHDFDHFDRIGLYRVFNVLWSGCGWPYR